MQCVARVAARRPGCSAAAPLARRLLLPSSRRSTGQTWALARIVGGSWTNVRTFSVAAEEVRLREQLVLDGDVVTGERGIGVFVGCITDVPGVDAIVNCGNEHMVGTKLPYSVEAGHGHSAATCTFV
eukprot:TRINITY_DN51344_c0_g1_i2.p2 TRINITY_DN51344_c0_g1~~TRINITY_DN51344_c0_g1_i2.p2  ORF type:complete len:127 (+),score=10.33 TRINITY_DN51344_c0_g1_i2:63-443(+)